MRLKYSFYILLFAALYTACNNQEAKQISNGLQAKIDSLKSVYTPDKRVALWDISISESSDTIKINGEVDKKESLISINELLKAYPNVINQVKLLPEDNNDQTINGLINNSVANLRSKPIHSAEIATQALLGTPVKILKEENGWVLIQTPNKYLAWVDKPAVVRTNKNEVLSYKESKKIVYNQQYGFSYSLPDENAQTVTDLVTGCILPVISANKNYYKVQYPDKRLAWVKKTEVIDFTDLINRQINEEELVKTAKKFLGIPYLWGGTSSKAIDCSGFTSSIYYMSGTILQRDASQQILYGKVITSKYESKDLKVGDMLFFGRKASDSKPERVTHVAMYIGNTEFIHASGRVMINSIDSTKTNFIPEYAGRFIRAVRINGEVDKTGFQTFKENDFYKEIIKFTEER